VTIEGDICQCHLGGGVRESYRKVKKSENVKEKRKIEERERKIDIKRESLC
jgi:hypothetical protein